MEEKKNRQSLEAFRQLMNEFQLELIVANREFCKRGMRNVVQKQVILRGPRGGLRYRIFDGENWSQDATRMNARQIRDQKRGILSGCVEGCRASLVDLE